MRVNGPEFDYGDYILKMLELTAQFLRQKASKEPNHEASQRARLLADFIAPSQKEEDDERDPA